MLKTISLLCFGQFSVLNAIRVHLTGHREPTLDNKNADRLIRKRPKNSMRYDCLVPSLAQKGAQLTRWGAGGHKEAGVGWGKIGVFLFFLSFSNPPTLTPTSDRPHPLNDFRAFGARKLDTSQSYRRVFDRFGTIFFLRISSVGFLWTG